MVFKIIKLGVILWCLSVPFVGVTARFPAVEIEDEANSFLERDAKVNYRLPNDTRPETYKLSLRTGISEGKFDYDGFISINILIVNATREVTIHSNGLSIKSIQLSNATDSIDLSPWQANKVTDFLIIPTKGVTLLPGSRCRLDIKFTGELQTGSRGFFRSLSDSISPNRRWIAATHFEPVSARVAFPCYDEPALKAKFTIDITHGANYSAVSNMPGEASRNPDGSVTTRFATTPLISSYLIAFAVTDFRSRENAKNSSLTTRVIATETNYEKTRFPLVEGEKAMNSLAKYLQVPYPLPKMDHIFVLNFGGAMENWGLIVYGAGMLINENDTSLDRRMSFFSVIAHELSHQWFGDIVSPKWWSVVWLNEGFAQFFQYVVIDLVYPEYRTFDRFAVDYVRRLFQIDAVPNVSPMTRYVEDPTSVHNLFDTITYQKSACVIRTLLIAFTETSFKKGLTNYLTSNAFTAVDEDDLFSALDRAAKEDGTLDRSLSVNEIFSSWSRQAGFPLLTVQRNYENGSITISQERYMADRFSALINSSTWWIPYNFATAKSPSFSDTKPIGWLPQNQRAKLIEQSNKSILAPSEWVLFNKQQTSYYRVMYDNQNWKLLIAELNSGPDNKIHPISRAQLLDDKKNFVQSGRLPADSLIEMVKYLKHESEYAPWVAGSEALLYLNDILATTKEYEAFRRNVVSIIGSAQKLIAANTLKSDSALALKTKDIVDKLACRFTIKSCSKDADDEIESKNDERMAEDLFKRNIKPIDN